MQSLSNDFYVQGLISREEFLGARRSLNDRLEANKIRFARQTSKGAVEAFIGQGLILRKAWDERSLDWRRSLVAALLEHVEILPGKAGRLPFNPERVRLLWRY